MRGSPGTPGPCPAERGSIPARAGEPPWRTQPQSPLTVYPRACGGAYQRPCGVPRLEGLSPRVRGSRAHRGLVLLDDGSIPARAGEPPPTGPYASSSRVYPRACGGAAWRSAIARLICGLSPRVRGSLHARQCGRPWRGSIPARAGEPPWAAASRSCPTVYPRACGGAAVEVVDAVHVAGLSPRVRGSLDDPRLFW